MCIVCLVTQSCPNSLQAHSLPGSFVHGILQARILGWVAMKPEGGCRGSSQPKNWTQVSCIAGRFFTIWATREVQEYWSGKPIPSPGDLPTKESSWGLLHCRQILYQLSYQGSLVVKNQPANVGSGIDSGSISGLGRYTGVGMVTLSSILAWRTPWTEEPGGLQSIGSQRVGHDGNESMQATSF